MPAPRQEFQPSSLAEGFLCVLAIGSVLGLLESQTMGVVPAAFFGIGFALTAADAFRPLRGTIGAACGAAGSIAAFIDLGQAAECVGANVPLTLALGALVVIVAALAWSLSVLGRRKNLLIAPLAVFGALEALAFFVLPFGVSLDQTLWHPLGVIVAIVAAVLLGTLVGFKPVFALFVFGGMIALAMLGVTSALGSACSPGPNGWGIGAVVTYLILFGAIRAIRARFVR